MTTALFGVSDATRSITTVAVATAIQLRAAKAAVPARSWARGVSRKYRVEPPDWMNTRFSGNGAERARFSRRRRLTIRHPCLLLRFFGGCPHPESLSKNLNAAMQLKADRRSQTATGSADICRLAIHGCVRRFWHS